MLQDDSIYLQQIRIDTGKNVPSNVSHTGLTLQITMPEFLFHTAQLALKRTE